MASHGVARPAVPKQQSTEAKAQEAKEIAEYRSLVEDVTQKDAAKDYSPELLQQTAVLLGKNPEYYTMWNIRRRIYSMEFTNLTETAERGEITEAGKHDQMHQIIRLDLQFLFPLLLKFPKCYWIWDHRIWLLEQSSIFLPTQQARTLWENELALVGKMLARDSRNYHGWGYRRFIVKNLQSSHLNGKSMAQDELDYTTRMIGNNLSNFSAWHNRTFLIVQSLDERSASSSDRQEMLDSEFELIHQALFDPYDQSLWFYYQNLLSTFDPAWSARSMAPDLSTEKRLTYLSNERAFLAEVLEDADDCKWVYQALLECSVVESKLRGGFTDEAKADVSGYVKKLQQLDPLRGGRWSDVEASIH